MFKSSKQQVGSPAGTAIGFIAIAAAAVFMMQNPQLISNILPAKAAQVQVQAQEQVEGPASEKLSLLGLPAIFKSSGSANRRNSSSSSNTTTSGQTYASYSASESTEDQLQVAYPDLFINASTTQVVASSSVSGGAR